jgi:hypothetical protein
MTDFVQSLLSDPRVDPTVEGQLYIKLAVERRAPEIVKLLLANSRVDPSHGEGSSC